MKPLSMKNKHIYVVVMCERPRFITEVNVNDRTCRWEATGTPYEFHSYDDAWYVCMGLMWRGQYAFPVITNGYEQKEPFYKEVKEDAHK